LLVLALMLLLLPRRRRVCVLHHTHALAALKLACFFRTK
jgi:hypothetical protein